jgi:wyosine [tRNA(Phe)-imidazoG37] synthetase (radical SAM superfamily)
MSRLLGLQEGIIYGPVNSRRLGRSLGINISPTGRKICSFNCVYCHYGWTKVLTTDLSDHMEEIPAPEEVERELATALERLSPPPRYITFSGNGESTLHPDFPEIVDAVLRVKHASGTAAKVAILSNSTAATEASVREALGRLDVRIMKLDAGTQKVMTRINRPAAEVSIEAITAGLKQIGDVTLQSVFVDGEVSNIADEEIAAWLDGVAEIGPNEVQVYSLENAPAMSSLIGVEPAKLEAIAEGVRRLGIRARAY